MDTTVSRVRESHVYEREREGERERKREREEQKKGRTTARGGGAQLNSKEK